jgi:hypothetical protein
MFKDLPAYKQHSNMLASNACIRTYATLFSGISLLISISNVIRTYYVDFHGVFYVAFYIDNQFLFYCFPT